jgi:hypothetical protein
VNEPHLIQGTNEGSPPTQPQCTEALLGACSLQELFPPPRNLAAQQDLSVPLNSNYQPEQQQDGAHATGNEVLCVTPDAADAGGGVAIKSTLCMLLSTLNISGWHSLPDDTHLDMNLSGEVRQAMA